MAMNRFHSIQSFLKYAKQAVADAASNCAEASSVGHKQAKRQTCDVCLALGMADLGFE